jgi:activator of 2-hydroxyglutaryl-CoA dehydratase
MSPLAGYVAGGRGDEKQRTGRPASRARQTRSRFREAYAPTPFIMIFAQAPPCVPSSASMEDRRRQAVLVSEAGDVLAKAYQLSTGNPIEDTIAIFGQLDAHVHGQGAALEILGVGTTGYAKDILREVLQADVALVETVAHAESALRLHPDPHVVVDVGGQDIKLIMLRHGRVTDFRLNTQCSAGNGYFLQATASALGVPLGEFADGSRRA